MKRINEIFLKVQDWSGSLIPYYLAVISLIIISLYYWYLPPVMFLWVAVWFMDIQNKVKCWNQAPLYHRLLYILFFSFFVWQILGLLYSDNQHDGWRNISLRLPFFLFPLVLILPGDMIRQKINQLLRLFALGTLFYLIICFGYALYRSLNIQNGILTFNPHPPVFDWLNYFNGYEFGIFHHPSYLAMYILFALFIAFESFLDNSINKSLKVLWLFVSIVFLIAIYLLASRAEILATVLAVPIYYGFKFKILGANRILGILVIICIFVLIPISISNPRLYYYFRGTSKSEISNKILGESRIVMWKSAFNIIRKNFVLGVGTGDIQDELNKEFMRSDLRNEIKGRNFNTHNQFIEVMTENGLIGLILFLSIFGIMLYISISEGNLLYTMFIFIVLFSFQFETMLNRLAGVAFFPLFSFLLLHINKNSGYKSVLP
jgi:O-antigen ligase